MAWLENAAMEDAIEDWLREQIELYDEEEQNLIDDFPQYQDDLCIALLEDEHCDTHGAVEGRCCLRKRRRTMEEASHFLEAWMSADFLKKMFRRGEVPRHFQRVIEFLDK